MGGGGGGGGGGGKGGGDWKAEVDEGWLRDRVELRKRTPLGQWEIFPRSPTPQRNVIQEAEVNQAQQEVTAEEAARAKNFQKGLKQALKDEVKDLKPKDKKDKGEKKDKKDKKKDKKEKKNDSSDEEESDAEKEKKSKKDEKRKEGKERELRRRE